MWSVDLPSICRRKLIIRPPHQLSNLIWVNLLAISGGKRYVGHSADSTLKSSNIRYEDGIDKFSLASNLANLVEESSLVDEKKPKSRLELKRFLELRIKRRVKDQFRDGKFHDLIGKVIANPYTLQDAYDSIRVNSNVNLSSESDDIRFDSLAEELSFGTFNVNDNLYSISTKGAKKETLVLPNIKLNIIQEAIRIALEVVYKPHYSKISHGCRSGRGQSSALKYICKEISSPDWWFTLVINKKVDSAILAKLISTMGSKIEDPKLYAIIHSMFEAGILNLEFGGFAKGHGLPQEGVLSPVLMNIYLDIFDREFIKLSMKYEALDGERDGSHSKLRGWFRRQVGHGSERNTSGVRVHCCRVMDEILIVIRGSKESGLALKSEIETYMRESLYLDTDGKAEILSCNDPRGIRFLGNVVRSTIKESPAVRAVHKLKEKVKLFALQKQEFWEEGAVRIGKKCLGHGFKKVKESEIKHLADSRSTLSQVSRFRKPGMETDHWYKVLLKIWMQEIDAKNAESEESILSKFVTEKALPQELTDSFYTFQKQAEKYVSSETESTLALLPESFSSSEVVSFRQVLAPLKAIKMCLQRYGITNSEGYPRACRTLVFLDDDHIIDWYFGIVHRWLRWYRLCDNFVEIKLVITEQVRQSCIRTLATKYRLHESEIERKFDSDLSRLPSSDEIENETLVSDFKDTCYDEGLLYGIPYSGSCLLSLARMVFARWYRAPELLFGAKQYGPGVDVWAAACIFAELLLRRPFLQGSSDIDQLGKIFAAFGTPKPSQWPDMIYLPDYVEYQFVPGQPLRTLFPMASDDALDLLSKMFAYDPKARISAQQALEHRYFSSGPPPTEPALLPRPPPKKESVDSKPSDFNPLEGPTVLSPTRKSRRVMPHPEGYEGNSRQPEKIDDHGNERSGPAPMSLDFSVFAARPPARPTINSADRTHLKRKLDLEFQIPEED